MAAVSQKSFPVLVLLTALAGFSNSVVNIPLLSAALLASFAVMISSPFSRSCRDYLTLRGAPDPECSQS